MQHILELLIISAFFAAVAYIHILKKQVLQLCETANNTVSILKAMYCVKDVCEVGLDQNLEEDVAYPGDKNFIITIMDEKAYSERVKNLRVGELSIAKN